MERKGIFYGVGVGPGDPELMTLKAVRLIRENEVIAAPGKCAEETLACRIAAQAVPELAEKTLLSIEMPMTRDEDVKRRCHEAGARQVESYLKQGENVVFLTLGDPTIYSTFSYLKRIVAADGYPTEQISGVPSFCAAAARAGVSLAEWDEEVHIVPAAHRTGNDLSAAGTYILMKSGKRIGGIRELLKKSGRDVVTVENCGLSGERVFYGADEIPDDAGYYSLILAKEPRP